ncbi:MAG: 2-isopropylmalate synthase [Acidobacteriota bacterium]|nr:MAG: 2-isopropylmalate synthase [Acidobacteriota bacterium]
MSKRVIIFDTTLRDGEQSPGASLTINEKLIIAKQLAKLGVDVIEAGFPIASEGDFEAVKLVSKNVKGSVICGLARTMPQDIDRAWEALKDAEKARIHMFIATSQIHREKKLRKSKEEVIEMATESIKRAKGYTGDVEFSPEDAARTDLDYMCDVVREAIAAGATTINIPDTVGYAQPEEFGQRIKYIFKKIPEAKDVVISVHCHNDLGLAVPNSLAAVQNGALQVECTVNGIGERAGNCSMEEVVMNLKTRKDFFGDFHCNVNTKEIFKTSRLVSSLTGIAVQRNKAIVGANAFAHEAGVHQHGVISHKRTYEIMNPEDIGWVGTNLVLGKHSGRHAVEKVVREMGYDVKEEQVDEIATKVKELADKKKELTRDDIVAIASDVVGELSEEETKIQLVDFQITTGNKTRPTATVELQVNGVRKVGQGTGVGPVDAASAAIRNVVDPKIKLKEFKLKAITGGTDALADVTVRLEDENGNIFLGDAIDQDVIMASVLALIKGMNRALNFKASALN